MRKLDAYRNWDLERLDRLVVKMVKNYRKIKHQTEKALVNSNRSTTFKG